MVIQTSLHYTCNSTIQYINLFSILQDSGELVKHMPILSQEGAKICKWQDSISRFPNRKKRLFDSHRLMNKFTTVNELEP